MLSACSEGSGSSEDVAAQYPNASEYQLELLEGGVTWAEYERAVIDMLACIEDQGVPTVGPYESGSGLDYEIGSVDMTASDAEFERVSQVHDECYEEHFSVVNDAYYEGIAPSEEEYLEIERNRRACARELGFDAPDDMSREDFYDIVAENVDKLNMCFERYPDFPPP